MKITIDADRHKALSLATQLERMDGVKNVSMKYRTKSIIKKE